MSKYTFKPPEDSDQLRHEFLVRTEKISDLMASLREKKMQIYGMNWMKRGFHSLFQNLDRKFGSIEEILWNKLIVRGEALSDDDFIYLCDAFIDLGNYAIFGRWYTEIAHAEKESKLKRQVEERTEVNPTKGKEGEQG